LVRYFLLGAEDLSRKRWVITEIRGSLQKSVGHYSGGGTGGGGGKGGGMGGG
jgi:hypothetical protein